MIDVSLHNVKEHLRVGLIKITLVYPITIKSHFRLLEPISILMSNGVKLEIPKGYQFDGSSSPRFLWWVFPSYGDFFFASLIHDYLYNTADLSNDNVIVEGKLFADKEMLLWSTILNNRNIGKVVDNYLRYYAVRIFGKKIYLK